MEKLPQGGNRGTIGTDLAALVKGGRSLSAVVQDARGGTRTRTGLPPRDFKSPELDGLLQGFHVISSSKLGVHRYPRSANVAVSAWQLDQ